MFICACCWPEPGWVFPMLSSVGGGLRNKVRVPSPFCSCRAARPERPLSDTTRDALQFDCVQTSGQMDCSPAAEQDGGDMSGSYRKKRSSQQCHVTERCPILWSQACDSQHQKGRDPWEGLQLSVAEVVLAYPEVLEVKVSMVMLRMACSVMYWCVCESQDSVNTRDQKSGRKPVHGRARRRR
ncbi:hypothetical protein INR49_015868 [Caranx melampygus]|nr:hypothetical protein INR49_015868 [Caranx melampygus]